MKKLAKNTEPANPEPTVTFNDKTYLVKDLPPEILELVRLHQDWTKDLAKSREEVFKVESALRGILLELEHRFVTYNSRVAVDK